MAVEMKGNALELMKALSVDEGLLQWLGASGYDTQLTPTGLTVLNPETGVLTTVATLNVQAIIAIKKGTLPDDQAMKLKTAITAGILAVQMEKDQPKPKNPAALKPSILGKLPDLPKAGTLAQAPSVQVWPEFPAGAMTTAPRVKLRDAEKMYQPVFGSSEDSRYYLIAGRADLKIAARWAAPTLSIRIEGKGLYNYKTAIMEAGLDSKGLGPNSDYTSMHLECGSEVVARKALGALLVGTNIVFGTPYPQLSVISGK